VNLARFEELKTVAKSLVINIPIECAYEIIKTADSSRYTSDLTDLTTRILLLSAGSSVESLGYLTLNIQLIYVTAIRIELKFFVLRKEDY
jgi:hypothetical protein